MNIQTVYSILLLLFCLLLSCKKSHNQSVDLLIQAQSIVEDNPTKALFLLDSIRNPQNMDKDHYMQYIVTDVQAKYKCYKDITGDTLIFEAEKYFNEKEDSNKAALANYYAGCVSYEQGVKDIALVYYMEAERLAKQARNNLLTGRSANNIGFLFFERNMFDQALKKYHQALNHYETLSNDNTSKLQILNSIGSAYKEIKALDSAYHYYNNGFELSKQLNNIPFQATFSHQLGITLRQKKNYKKSYVLFREALNLTSNKEEATRISLSLCKLFFLINQIDSSKYYTDIIKKELSHVSNSYTLESMYRSLADYNEQTENYQEANRYNKLVQDVSRKISEENSAEKLIEAENEYKSALKQKEYETTRMQSYIYLFLFFITLLISLLIIKNIKQQQQIEKNKYLETDKLRLESDKQLLEVQNKLLEMEVKSIEFSQSIYRNFVKEWMVVEKKIKKLIQEYGATQEPELYIQIRTVIENVKSVTNQQMIDNAKKLLLSKPSGDKALELLNDKELLVLMACYSGYNKTKELAYILGMAAVKTNMDMYRYSIKNKLVKAGRLDSDLEAALFPQQMVEQDV